jgi:alkylation response protein AidB-like acyl-CoA dehydrogenase
VLVGTFPLERLYREVRAPRIYEGTSEIQQMIIANHFIREKKK